MTSSQNPMPLSGGDYIHDERGLARVPPKAESAPGQEHEQAAADTTPAPSRPRSRISAAASN